MSVDYLNSGYNRRQVKQTSQELMRIDRDQKKLETRWAERAGKGGPAFARRATALTPAQDAKLSDAFALFDTDGSGTIDVQELQALAEELGARLSLAQAEAVFGQIDTDQSGEIDADEFTSWWQSQGGAHAT